MSTGQTRQHIEVVQEPVQLFDEITDDFRRQAFSLLFNQTLQDLHFDTRVRVSDDFDGIDLENARRIQRQTNTFDELCDWWIAKCPLVRDTLYTSCCSSSCTLWRFVPHFKICPWFSTP